MNPYLRRISHNNGPSIEVDLYDIAEGYGMTCPAQFHALKKILCAGQRGSKPAVQDLREAIVAIERATCGRESVGFRTVACAEGQEAPAASGEASEAEDVLIAEANVWMRENEKEPTRHIDWYGWEVGVGATYLPAFVYFRLEGADKTRRIHWYESRRAAILALGRALRKVKETP